MARLSHGREGNPSFLLKPRLRLLLNRSCTDPGSPARHIDLTASRAYRRMVGYRLGNYLPALPPGFSLLPNHMLLLMTLHRRGRQLRHHIGRRLKGHPGVIRAVLVLPLFTGLAHPFGHNLLGGLGLGNLRLQLLRAEVLDAVAYRQLCRVSSRLVLYTGQPDNAWLIPAYCGCSRYRCHRPVCRLWLGTGYRGYTVGNNRPPILAGRTQANAI